MSLQEKAIRDLRAALSVRGMSTNDGRVSVQASQLGWLLADYERAYAKGFAVGSGNEGEYQRTIANLRSSLAGVLERERVFITHRDAALERVEELRRDELSARRALFLVVQQAGGEVRIPRRALEDFPVEDGELQHFVDPETGDLIYRATVTVAGSRDAD